MENRINMGFWNNLFKFGVQNMAIDLGTANTLVYVQDPVSLTPLTLPPNRKA